MAQPQRSDSGGRLRPPGIAVTRAVSSGSSLDGVRQLPSRSYSMEQAPVSPARFQRRNSRGESPTALGSKQLLRAAVAEQRADEVTEAARQRERPTSKNRPGGFGGRFLSVFRNKDHLELKTLNFEQLTMKKYGEAKRWNDLGIREQVALIRAHLTFRKFIIDPNSAYIKGWDLVLLVCLIYALLVTPYEIALLQPGYDVLYIVEIVVNFCFLQDMIIQFFLKVKVTTKQGTVWLRKRGKIAARYLRTWFIPDLLSIIPFDQVTPLIFKDDGLSKLKIIRVVRVLRLFKLGRILKTSRIYKRWENRISLKGSTVYLIKFTSLILVTCHWMACVWAFFGVLYSDDLNCNSGVPYSFVNTTGRDPNNPDDWAGRSWIVAWAQLRATSTSMNPCDHFMQYLASMYWAVVTITSTGYGDILPQSPAEYVVCTILLLASSIMWAYIIGAACAVMANMDPEGREFQQRMDAFNEMAQDQKLHTHIRYRGREYLREARFHMHYMANKAAIDHLGPDLQSTVCQQMAEHYLQDIWFFKTSGTQFREDTARKFVPHFYERREVVEEWGKLCVVERGSVGRAGIILVPWGFWGEDMIIRLEMLRAQIYAVALTFTEIVTLSREDLSFALMDYPEEISRFRKAASKLALMRFVRVMKEERESGIPSKITMWMHEVMNSATQADNRSYEEQEEVRQKLAQMYEVSMTSLNPPIGEAELTPDQKIDWMFQAMKPALQRLASRQLTFGAVVSAGPEELQHRPSRKSVVHPANALLRNVQDTPDEEAKASTGFFKFRKQQSKENLAAGGSASLSHSSSAPAALFPGEKGQEDGGWDSQDSDTNDDGVLLTTAELQEFPTGPATASHNTSRASVPTQASPKDGEAVLARPL